MPGEFDFISWLRRQPATSPLVRLGIGDDLAVLKLPPDDLLLVGVDQVLDGVHFDSAAHSPRAIGRKAMNRNLSDCAAMGCLPAAAVATLALPRGVGEDYARELYLGMTEAGQPFNCPVVGGDTGSWPGKLVVTVTILGRSDGIAPVTRAGAKPGDGIYVTGPLGGSILGRHMTFNPKLATARFLVKHGVVSAMIDLSDGLSRDLAHICRESGVGALLDAGTIPIHDDAIEMRRDGHSPLEHALHDGEDYELLYTVPPLVHSIEIEMPDPMTLTMPGEKLIRLPGSRIGTIVPNLGVSIQSGDGSCEPLDPKSWEHTF
jgi:thiamine-monophosphate kinase